MAGILQSANMFGPWLWRASWQASVAILLVLLTQLLLRKRLPPAWRHALWLLVMVRLALPWSLPSHLSLFNWLTPPSRIHSIALTKSSSPALSASPLPDVGGITDQAVAARWSVGLPMAWVTGAAMLGGYILITTWRLSRHVRQLRPVTDSAVLDLLEDCKQEMGVRTPLTIVETHAVRSPSLFGFVRPRLLLPTGFNRNFSMAELRFVLLHELSHVKRGDVPVNWLLAVPLVIHWFNPLVWYAFSRMRMDREVACDDLALRRAREVENRPYGQTIIKLLEGFSRPAVLPGLLGILEDKNQMKRRINMIAIFQRNRRWPVAAVMSFTVLTLITLTDACRTAPSPPPSTSSGDRGIQDPPVVVATSPAVGAMDMAANLREVTVTFDRDMGKGFSWTGGGSEFPAAREGDEAHWRDEQTCVLPVDLEAGHYYRVGINSSSYLNFRSAAGIPASPSAIYFTTVGAAEDVRRQMAKPRIVELNPPNGADAVDPGVTELRVTFDTPMSPGFSWTDDKPGFPAVPGGKNAFWTPDHRTCVLPVALKPGRNYKLGLNDREYQNFQSQGGIPLEPLQYSFRTRG